MTRSRSASTLRIGLVTLGLSTVAVLSGLGAKSAPVSTSKISEPLNGGAEYVGEAVCIACHAAQNNQFTHTLHANVFRLNPKNELQQRTCEACHGPGSNHIKDPANPANHGALIGYTREWGTPVEKQNSMCLTCHKGGNATFWSSSAHGRNQLACSDCHNPMARLSDGGLLRKTSINETCYTCHKQQRAEFSKRSHMPLPEGKITCVDCHNPHGSTSKTMLKADSVNELCVTCHAEKRGPFLWEHAPVRENCLNCHNPHGANQDKLLQVARPFLCQQCHGNPDHQSMFYHAGQMVGGGSAVSARMLGRSCQNCHSQIHGSNDPSGARFQR